MASLTLSLLLRSTAPRRSIPLAVSTVSRSSIASSSSAHLLTRPSQRYASTPSAPSPASSTSIPTPPPSVQATASAEPVKVGGEDQVVTKGPREDTSKLFSDPDTLSYRELLNIFSKTLTDAFSTPPPRPSAADRQYIFKSTGEWTQSLKRPGMQIMEDPGTYHMVERIRQAGIGEGMELEAVNQHILEVLDAIAPPPTEVTFSAEQRVAEAESELKEALVMLQSVKAENLARYHESTAHKLYSFLPASIAAKLDARKLAERNRYDARLRRLMARIFDCGFEAKRDPKEMSLLVKRGYFPPNDPDAIPAESEEEKAEAGTGEVIREYKAQVGHTGMSSLSRKNGMKF